MGQEMERTLSLCTGEYGDVRYECDRITQIKYVGRELNTVSECDREGYHLRILKDGGLGSYTLNHASELPDAVKKAEDAATLSGRFNDPPIQFKFGPTLKETVSVSPDEDPRKISLDEKVALLTSYRDLVLSMPKVQTANLTYVEWAKTKRFTNTLGSRISIEEVIAVIAGEIIAKEGDRIENIRLEMGGGADFSLLRSREDVCEKRCRLAADLLNAEPVKPGSYRVLLNPSMVGVFIHEAFGHYSEADNIKDNPSLLEKLKLDTKIAADTLSVVDDPTLANRPGYKIIDDEGIRCEKTQLIDKGVLKGRLHNMETAAQMDSDLTGNAVAVGCSHRPIVRMSNIFIQPGESSFDDLLAMVDEGLYICDPKGGSTMGDQFAFGAQYGYVVRKGKIENMISGIVISGNLFKTMMAVKAVGNDLRFQESGGCGKGGQTNPQSGLGGPHVIIDPVIIG
ncbi:TldD/PmbA family protein [Acidobacteriota bacterium]